MDPTVITERRIISLKNEMILFIPHDDHAMSLVVRDEKNSHNNEVTEACRQEPQCRRGLTFEKLSKKFIISAQHHNEDSKILNHQQKAGGRGLPSGAKPPVCVGIIGVAG